ncbi:acetyl-CoA synthetase-like protein [Sparassis latifolia]|uniref:Long-chain-fatty-acid--CoA ligase 2 n=1 Tax=Sparassis crispa TaxID=139825 RepID=A0A401GJK7_9APHY|nr:Long-chain-fatty-acid--CoA ligase 2 [Sparassis crispa]GBE82345.1 Long-chain-fatty-acid--CoA ligase 2 [Sparassis crispa]
MTMKEYIKYVEWHKDQLNYDKQMVEVPGTKRPGQTGHYRTAQYPLITLQTPNMFTTLDEMFEEGLRVSANSPCLGHRPLVSAKPLQYADHYVWQSYATVDARKRALGSGLHKLFRDGVLGGGEYETVGIWSRNTPEWQIVDFCAHAYQKVSVGLYDTLGKDALEYIINHAEISVVFVTLDHIPFLLQLGPKVPTLRMIVVMDSISPESRKILGAWGQERNIIVRDILEVEELGAQNPMDPVRATPDQLATICYTSGTTGNPKGVMLTHGNLAIAAQGHLCSQESGKYAKGRRAISYLPLAHIFERTMSLVIVAMGGAIGFSTGDPLRLLEDVQVLKPHFMSAVPRVLNRIYQAAMIASTAPGLKGALFNRAVSAKLERLHTTGERKHAIWDRLVFSKVAAALGGHVDLLAVGSAPISPAVMDFIRIALLCDVLEGYGMTENCGTCTHVWYADPSSSGTVGPVTPNTEIKLVDVPSMGYTAEDKPFPRGEIVMRGDHCFKRYYKDEKNTRATIDEEGWVHTGDVGLFDEHLRVKIIDRVKNIMKLAQGEYVALENIENVYSSCPLVAQLFVHGDSLQSYLVAVVVPDPAQLSFLVSRLLGRRIDPEDISALATAVDDPRVQSAILSEMTEEARTNKLKGFEMIKRIHATLDAFTVDNGCLTPTLKVRRPQTYEKFKDVLDALYELPELSSSKL